MDEQNDRPFTEGQSPPQLEALLDILELMTQQARAYERALPPDNYPARAPFGTGFSGIARTGSTPSA